MGTNVKRMEFQFNIARCTVVARLTSEGTVELEIGIRN
jgi:hypothetical protein